MVSATEKNRDSESVSSLSSSSPSVSKKSHNSDDSDYKAMHERCPSQNDGEEQDQEHE